MKRIFIYIVLIMSTLSLLNFNKLISPSIEKKNLKELPFSNNCTYKGKKLYGKVQFVTSHPDIKIQYVDANADINVQMVTSSPSSCGKWQEVSSSPDIKVQIVNSFPDLKVKLVKSNPGMK